MIIIGDVPVLPHGFGPSLYSKKGMAFYRAVADAVHREGCMLCAQLHQSDSDLKAMLKYVPGVLTKRISMEELRPLLHQQVGLHYRLAGKEGGANHRRIRPGGSAGSGGWLRHGSGAWGSDVRQLQLRPVQPPYRPLRRQPGQSGQVRRGGGIGHTTPPAPTAH